MVALKLSPPVVLHWNPFTESGATAVPAKHSGMSKRQ